MPGWHTTSRHVRGYGHAWTRVRAAALARDLHLCQTCLAAGRTTPATQVHHLTPKAAGGTDALANLQSVCRDCHARLDAEAQGRQAPRPLRRVGLDGYPV